ncbi:EboA domain-containing protein [Streptomyces olivoreticuli]|uniref:EboA domain-containing protein n=1 Tax=Streptomyces olivoreticuli TaxID=68246 RepID=UPI0026587DB5|nr:EboA domain-containing protein [Streptomyces olivoreticuli]WKK21362.1 EboA domain-containing protein [Streptomyces olivoreticuli]
MTATATATLGPATEPAGSADALTERTLRESLHAALDADARAWLDRALGEVADSAAALHRHFPAAGRGCGRGPLPGWAGWSIADAARTVLLLAASPDARTLVSEAVSLYHRGDAYERIGVLRALPFLPIGPAALSLVDDALRTNDTRLIGAAVGPYACRHLDQDHWRQAVLKCLFTGIRLSAVAGLDARRDAELAAMAERFAQERRAAGRPVPDDTWLLTHAR